jgi:hypothetical protein
VAFALFDRAECLRVEAHRRIDVFHCEKRIQLAHAPGVYDAQ